MITRLLQSLLILTVMLIAVAGDSWQSEQMPSAQVDFQSGKDLQSESGLILAGAAEAAVDSTIQATLFDHYGDPAGFVKYIIRRPPVHA